MRMPCLLCWRFCPCDLVSKQSHLYLKQMILSRRGFFFVKFHTFFVRFHGNLSWSSFSVLLWSAYTLFRGAQNSVESLHVNFWITTLISRSYHQWMTFPTPLFFATSYKYGFMSHFTIFSILGNIHLVGSMSKGLLNSINQIFHDRFLHKINKWKVTRTFMLKVSIP